MRSLLRDFVALTMLVLASLAAGLVLNKFSHHPLPIVYQTPEQRFNADLTTRHNSALRHPTGADRRTAGIPFGHRS
jgi:hypothetical protein